MTVSEMQQRRLFHQMYVWDRDRNQLMKVKKSQLTSESVGEVGSIKLDALLVHFQEMRGLCYNIINILTIGNAKMMHDLLVNKHPNLLSHLKQDLWNGFSD